MSKQQKSILFNTSAGTDVQYVGGEIQIPGLDPIKQSNIVDFSQVNYRAEVSQVVTVGATTYTPTASTRYIVTINDVRVRRQGLTGQPLTYSFTTPANVTSWLGGVAATQREAIHVALIADINAAGYNYVTAATLTGGAGFTITDVPGYFPVNSQTMTNREGASTIKLMTDDGGLGFEITNIALTTAAVYASGVGATLASSAPVWDLVYTNLISGYIDGPKTIAGATAVSGQKYNMFSITYKKEVSVPTTSSYDCFQTETVQVWVDNGAGSATTNLAGYIAIERAMHRGIAAKYATDPSAVSEFFDNNFIIQGPLGAVPVTTTSLKNKFLTGYANMFNHYNIGTQTIVAPTQGATGLLAEQDVTATEGAHYCTEVGTNSPKQFIVGKQEITFVFKATCTTVANIVLLAGLRLKAAFAADFNDYTDMVAGGTGPSGTDLYTYGILNNAATVATDTTLNAVDATQFTVLIKVAKSGLVSMYINDTKVNVYSAGTTALILDAGDAVIPFWQYTNLNSAAAVPNVQELLALPNANIYYK